MAPNLRLKAAAVNSMKQFGSSQQYNQQRKNNAFGPKPTPPDNRPAPHGDPGIYGGEGSGPSAANRQHRRVYT